MRPRRGWRTRCAAATPGASCSRCSRPISIPLATRSCLDGPTGIEQRGGGTATIESESRERLRIHTASETAGLLVLGRAWLPHYRAQVDGAAAAPIQANFGQLALEVPAGAHIVEIWVDRRPFEAALGGSGLGALGLGAIAMLGGRRRREQPAACQPLDGVKESAG